MERISNGQLVALTAILQREFAVRLVMDLRQKYRLCIRGSFSESLSFVLQEIQDACECGLTSDESVEHHVTASWLLGTPVRQCVEISAVYNDSRMAPSEKAQRALEFAVWRTQGRI